MRSAGTRRVLYATIHWPSTVSSKAQPRATEGGDEGREAGAMRGRAGLLPTAKRSVAQAVKPTWIAPSRLTPLLRSPRPVGLQCHLC